MKMGRSFLGTPCMTILFCFFFSFQSELYQDDLYPDTADEAPAISAEDWFHGKDADPILVNKKKLFILFINAGFSKLLVVAYNTHFSFLTWKFRKKNISLV